MVRLQEVPEGPAPLTQSIPSLFSELWAAQWYTLASTEEDFPENIAVGVVTGVSCGHKGDHDMEPQSGCAGFDGDSESE